MAADNPQSNNSRVRTLRTIEEIETVRKFWSESVGSRDSDIDVLLTEIRSDSSNRKPHVLLLEEGGHQTALLVGRIVRRPPGFRIGYYEFSRSPVNVMTFPHGSLRGDVSSDDCKQLVRTIVGALKSGEADVAIFEQLSADSVLYKWAKLASGFLSRDHFPPHRPHRKRDLPDSVNELYASLSGHERKRFRQIQRKLEKDFPGQVRIDRFVDAQDLERALRVVEEISKKTWQAKIGKGIRAEGPQMELFRLEAQKSWLRIYTLYVSGQPCAYWIGNVYQGSFYSDFVGFDPTYSQYSPGMYLLSQMMEEFCASGVRTIDFGFTDEDYKKRFGNVLTLEARLHVFAPTLRGIRLAIFRTATVLINESARWVLARTNLIQRTKKFWRTLADRPKQKEPQGAQQ